MRVVALLALVIACNGFDRPGQPKGRAHPFADAGTGSSYRLGTTVALDGSRSFDPDGGSLAYSWSVVKSPAGSTAMPADSNATATTFVPDQYGTYVLRLQVSDAAQNTDTSDLRIVATGAITAVNAGPDATAVWLDTVQLAGSVSTAPGHGATYAWRFVSRPAGSTASLANATTLTPTFLADAAGNYVVALDANVGDETAEDTVTVDVTAPAPVSIGTGITAYTYSKFVDRIVYVHYVGHAEVVKVDPTTGARVAANTGAFTPRSISTDTSNNSILAIGGIGGVETVSVSNLTVMSSKYAPGCTAKHVTVPYASRVDCFPEDGTTEPISSVDMSTGQVTQIPCPVQFPDVALTPAGQMFMVDGATPQIYLYDAVSTPPLPVITHGSLAGIAPPVIAGGTNNEFAVTGNGLVVSGNGALLFDLQTPMSAGAFSGNRYEIAMVSGDQLKVFSADGKTLKLSAVIPSPNGMALTPKLVAYSSDEHRLILVVGTSAGDVAYTVPR